MARAAIRQRSGIKSFRNSTRLDSERLLRMCLDAVAEWRRLDRVAVSVRYSRGADFSGTCCYQTGKVYINLGRHLTYPYHMGTHLARARSDARRWWKPIYTIELADAYQVVLFVFLHEWFHLLVKWARRNIRQKESMCDRFAARVLVDRYGAVVRDESNRPAPRDCWDFQDLDGFVVAARRTFGTRRPAAVAARGAITVQQDRPPSPQKQLLLFDL